MRVSDDRLTHFWPAIEAERSAGESLEDSVDESQRSARSADVTTYAASMLKSLRLMMSSQPREDLDRLNYLLEAAEKEASNLAPRSRPPRSLN